MPEANLLQAFSFLIMQSNIPQNWEFYLCSVDENPAKIRVNLALNEWLPNANYTKVTWFYTKFQTIDEYGFHTSEEFDKLCQIEDEIANFIENKGGVMLGVIKSNGILDLYFQSSSSLDFEKHIQEIMYNTFPEYEFGVQSGIDPEAETYYSTLYPNEFELLCIQNNKVLSQLENNEDDFEKERNIDYWLVFNTEENRTSFVKNIELQGFEIKDTDKIPNENHPWMLCISRVDFLKNINEITWNLTQLAKEYNGIYDGWESPIIK